MNKFHKLLYNVSKLSISEKKVLITLLNKDINSGKVLKEKTKEKPLKNQKLSLSLNEKLREQLDKELDEYAKERDRIKNKYLIK
jgi:cell division protein FtsI/penicillin-binding protein 2